jgi:hypothetical protein
VSGRTHAGHLAQQFDIRRRMIEVVVANNSTERLPAEDTVLFLVQLLEDGRLVPSRSFELGKRLAKFLL